MDDKTEALIELRLLQAFEAATESKFKGKAIYQNLRTETGEPPENDKARLVYEDKEGVLQKTTIASLFGHMNRGTNPFCDFVDAKRSEIRTSIRQETSEPSL